MELPDINELMGSDVWELRAQAGMRLDLTNDQVEVLLNDPDPRVRRMTADLHREVSGSTIEHALQRYPTDAENYAYHHNAPPSALGYKHLTFVTNEEALRYVAGLDSEQIPSGELLEALAARRSELITLNDLLASLRAQGDPSPDKPSE